MALEAPGQAGGPAPDACAEPGGGGWGGGLSRGRGGLYGMGERGGVVRYGAACYPRPQPKINGPSQTPTPPLPSHLVKLIGDICGTGAGMHRRGGGVPQHLSRDAFEEKGPQRRSQRRLGRRLEEVAKAVGGGCCRLQMPLKLVLGVGGAVAGHRLGALEGGWRGGGGGAGVQPNIYGSK